MRVNIYAEEMTERVEIVTKTIEGQEFKGVRFYLYLPVSVARHAEVGHDEVQGPFIHRDGDDDSAAVTFWGKGALRDVLMRALQLLDSHHVAGDRARDLHDRVDNVLNESSCWNRGADVCSLGSRPRGFGYGSELDLEPARVGEKSNGRCANSGRAKDR